MPIAMWELNLRKWSWEWWEMVIAKHHCSNDQHQYLLFLKRIGMGKETRWSPFDLNACRVVPFPIWVKKPVKLRRQFVVSVRSSPLHIFLLTCTYIKGVLWIGRNKSYINKNKRKRLVLFSEISTWFQRAHHTQSVRSMNPYYHHHYYHHHHSFKLYCKLFPYPIPTFVFFLLLLVSLWEVNRAHSPKVDKEGVLIPIHT